MKFYPEEELYQEMAFISYYFHWSNDEVMNMEHAVRRRWCEEISSINKNLNPSKEMKRKEKSIFEMRPTAELFR